MRNLIGSALKWAFILAAAGELKTATLIMMRKAAKASTPGLISLSPLNHALQAPASERNSGRRR